MSSLRNRVMAFALSVLTAVTTCAGTVPAWADTVQSNSTAGSSAEQTTETAVINVKIDSVGGSVVVGDGSSQKTVLMQDDGTIKTTDAEGNETAAAVDEAHPYAVTLTETKGAAVPVTATASDGYDVSTYTVTIDGGSENVGFVSGDTFSYSLTADRDKTVEIGFTKKAETQPQAQAQPQSETEAPAAEEKQIDTSAYDDMDFTSARLLVGTEDASVVAGDQDYILSSYDGLYLIQYPDVQSAKEAYAGYVKTADFVDIDNATISAADGADITDVTADSAMTESSNPLAELADAPSGSSKKGTIALIDTGASDSSNITESVSMLGDDASDDNGHGSQMVQYITEEDPDAKILSIKALDANGNGTPSSVTAAIRYAVEKKVSVINLSLSGTKTAESSAVEEAVKEAVNAGIVVIGAAGNNGKNAKYYIPGGIEDAVIAGSVNSIGSRLSSSNFGDTVDYYVVSGSTSEAAARLSGIFSKEGKIEADDKTIFTTAATKDSKTDEDNTDSTSDDIKAANGGSGSTGATGGGGIGNVHGFYVWYDAGKSANVRVDKNTTVADQNVIKKADAFRTKAIEHNAISGALSTIDVNGVENYRSLYNKAAVEALKDAASRSKTNRARIVGAIGIYTIGSDGSTAFPIHSFPETKTPRYYGSWQELTNMRADNGSGLPDSLSWNSVHYNNGQATKQNWRQWLYEYGLNKVRSSKAGFVGTTVIVYAVAEDEPKPNNVYAQIHKSGANGAGSVAGAEYEIWYDGKGSANGGKGTGQKFVIGKDGYSNTVSLEPGHTYWYHEYKKPSNGNYLQDDHWYQFSANQVASHTSASNPLVLQTSDTPYVYIQIHKTGTQAAGSVAGAKYEIWYDGKGGAGGGKGTGKSFIIDSDGYSDVVQVEPGHTYWYHEYDVPSNGNYLQDDNWYQVTADQVKDHISSSSPLILNTSDTPTTYVYLTKSSSNTDVTHNNQCYSLKDGAFELTNASTGKKYTLTTDEYGNTPTIAVEIGTYHVTEITAPHGYQKNTNIPDITVTADNVKTSPCHIQVQDTPGVDPVPLLLQKKDAETGKGTPQGAGSLAGAQYTVKYYDVQNADEDSLKDATPLRTWVLTTNKNGYLAMSPSYKVSGDEFYYDTLTNVVGVPVGTILIQETKAPDGYQLNDQTYVIHFNPDADGIVKRDVKAIYANDDAADQVKALESPRRGGLNFQKYDTNNNPMAGIPFVITSETTGESHVIIADANGRINTEANKHSNHTNGNDSLIRKTAEGAYVCDDPSKLDASAGIWFGEAPADDSKMALLFDKYTISEVFVKSLNYGKNISNVRKNDTKENKAGFVLGVVIDTNGKNVSLDPEVWENPDVTLGTTAKNADVDSKNIALTDTATVVDTVSYENLTPGDSYILKGKLVDKDNPSAAIAEAETSFTPSKKDGTVDVTFHFSASNLEGKTLVAFEYLNWKGIEIAKHENTGDTAQTVYVPKIRTTLTDKSVEDEVGVKAKEDTLVDKVQYWNLAPHENFIIKGQLIQKSTGKVLATAETGEFSVSAKSMNGTKDVTFTFDSTGLAGETVVAYEKLYHVSDKGDLYELDQHENLEDTAQSVYFPKIGTTAKDGRTSDHVGTSGKTETLIDTVKLNNVVVGKEYTVRGTLVDKKTGKAVLVNNKEITAEGTVTFDANGKAKVTGSASNAQGVLNAKNSSKTIDGSVDLTFTFNSSVLEGQTVVAFEKLLHKNIEVESHSDIKDEEQSVHYPKVGTAAKDGYTQDTVGTVGAKATIVDTVKLENLVPGMIYTVSGILKDQESGADFTVNGKTVTQSASVTVNADGTLAAKNNEKVTAVFDKEQNRVDGTVDLTFTFDSSALSGKSVVAFENLQHNNVTVAVHNDITDEGQTVHYPAIHTSARDTRTGDHVGSIFGEMINKVRAMLGDEDVTGDGIKDSVEQEVIDRVALENLVPGKTYTVSGKLMDTSTGKAVVIDGKTVTQKAEITVSEDGTKITAANHEAAAVTKYDAKHHNTDGYVELSFKFDSSKLVNYGTNGEAGTGLVVFEDLIHNNVTVNTHSDLTDASQTVGDVGIHTTAVDSRTGDHVGDSPRKAETHSSVADEKETTITDTVNMTKLVQGAEYTVKGYLVVQDKSTKDHPAYLKADGSTTANKEEAVKNELTFTVNADSMSGYQALSNSLANGSVALTFPVKSSLVSGRTIVVFEDLYHNNVKISTHSDISDEKQSVHYPDVETSTIDKDTKDDVGTVHKTATIVDTVQLTNLVPGMSYTVNGTLHDQKSGDIFKDADGNAVTQKAEISVSADGKTITAKNGEKVTVSKTGTAVSGTVDLTFTFDSSLLSGKTLVAFEDLKHNGIMVATHSDIHDESQSEHYPAIHTEATDTRTGDHAGSIFGELINKVRAMLGDEDVSGDGIKDNSEQTIIDHVKLENLALGKEYTVSGVLMDQNTGKAIEIDGKKVTQTAVITTSTDGKITAKNGEKTSVTAYDAEYHRVDGYVDLTYKLDSSKLVKYGSESENGAAIVVFEDLIHNGVTVNVHHDISDAGQTVGDVGIHTTAVDSRTGDHVGDSPRKAETHSSVADEKETAIIDTVNMTKLVKGYAYTVKGYLVVQDDSTKTKAVYLKADGSTTSKKSEAVSATKTFTADAKNMQNFKEQANGLANGSVALTFPVKSSLVSGKTIVVFEDLYHNNVKISTHSDISDEKQSVHYPDVETSTIDKDTKDDVGTVHKTATIVDTVQLTNLVPGMSYTVNGTLHDQKSGDIFKDADGNAVTQKAEISVSADGKTITAKNSEKVTVSKTGTAVSGTVDLTFTFDSSLLSGKTLVAFEDLKHNGITVATHSDIHDESQSEHYPEIHTTAVDKTTGDHVGSIFGALINGLRKMFGQTDADGNGIADDRQQNIVDTVTLANLVPGKSYVVSGKLMDADTGKAVVIDGKEITSSTVITVSKDGISSSNGCKTVFDNYDSVNYDVDGSVDLTFTLDSSKIQGVETVVFERLYHADGYTSTTETPDWKDETHLINKHEDKDDNGQSVSEVSIHTTAVDMATGNDQGVVPNSYVPSSVIEDTVELAKLVPGASYQIRGRLVDLTDSDFENGKVVYLKSDGSATENIDEAVTVTSDEFEAKASEETHKLQLTVSGSLVQGKDVTVFEDILHNGVVISSHPAKDTPETWDKDEFKSQTVHYMTGKTNATDGVENIHSTVADGTRTIEDKVYFQNLVAGKTYSIEGTLHDKATGETLTDKGATRKVTFTASEDLTEAAYDNIAANTKTDEERAAELEAVKAQVSDGLDRINATEEQRRQAESYVTDDSHNTYTVTASDEELTIGYEKKTEIGTYTSALTLTKDGGSKSFISPLIKNEPEEAETETSAQVSDLKVTEHFDGTKTISGYVTLKFTVDASELAGHTLVAFEKFTNEGKEIFVHEDLEDLPQTIKIPKIGTTAKVGELDETALYNEDGTPKEFTITDTVSYENLWTKDLLDKLHEEGLTITDNGTVIVSDHMPVYDINETGEYTVTGKLMDKATGKALTDVNGNEYETSVHFVPDAENGTVDVTFTLNAADFIDKDGSCILDGKSLVVFEDLYQVPEDGETSEENHTAVHHDVDDQGQDIRFPKGRTHATDYTDGELTQDELSALTQEDLAKIAADHESEVTIDSHEAEATDAMKILDMVSYSNLHAATEYTVTGTLQVVTERDENGKAVKWEPALDDDGKEITQTVTFTTPEDEDGQDSVSGYVPVLFSFKGVSLAGKTTVAFEKFTREGQDVMVHHDITDKPQTDYIPSIHTNATDSVTGNHNGVVGEKTYVIDEVSYENLQKGNTYKLSAQLMDKDSSKSFGSAVEGTFVAGTDGQFITPDGTVISTMDGMRKALKDNSKLETVKNTEKTKKTTETAKETTEPSVEAVTAEVGNGIAKGNYVVTANEWKDGNWGFVHVFDKNPENGGKLVNAVSLSDGSSVISLTDGEFVQYFNVNLHKNSKVEVSEIDAEKIEEIYNADMDEIASLKSDTAENTDETDESSEETSGKTAETNVTVSADSQSEAVENENDRVSGSVYVVIPVDTSKLGGHTLVAFEKLYTNPENGTPKEIAHHEDINDEDQSVHYIDVHTNATDKKDGDKTLATSGTVTVNDKVSFKNLIPGKKYKVAGTLMDKKTGKPLTVNGKTVTSESTFTPNKADGYVNMEFTFDVSTVASGDYVVFEKLYDSESGAEIAKHEDLNDKSQTVTVPERPEIQTSDRPISPVLPIAAGAAVVVIIAAVLLGRKKKTDK